MKFKEGSYIVLKKAIHAQLTVEVNTVFLVGKKTGNRYELTRMGETKYYVDVDKNLDHVETITKEQLALLKLKR